MVYYPDGRINLEKKDAAGKWFVSPLAYAGFTQSSYDLGKHITYNCTKLITEITDFNDARTFGSYRSSLVAQIQSIANRPSDLTVNGHVRLDVMALSEGASYILQRLYFMSTGGDFRIYHRVYLTSWGAWEREVQRDDLQSESITATNYFTIKPSEGVSLQIFKKNASLNFSGTFGTNIPSNANTTIATLPTQYRPKYASYGIIKVWPVKDGAGNITTPADTGLLGLYADGALKVVNHFGQTYTAGRYVAGSINYVIA